MHIIEPAKICPKCQKSRLFSKFSLDKRSPTGHCCWCKFCVNDYSELHYHSRVKKGLCARCGKKNDSSKRVVCIKCSVIQSQETQRRYRKLKIEIISFYSKGRMRCMCPRCPITHIDLLTVDHIQGNGRKHNKKIGTSGGAGLYLWLKKNRFPAGFQILCGACNMAKHEQTHCSRAGRKH